MMPNTNHTLPLPLREGVWGRGRSQYRTNTSRFRTPPPNSLRLWEGENVTPRPI
jgi:hypothetical protein